MKMTKEVRDALSHILSYDFEDEYFKVGVELIVEELSHIMMNAEIKEYEDGAELRKEIAELKEEKAQYSSWSEHLDDVFSGLTKQNKEFLSRIWKAKKENEELKKENEELKRKTEDPRMEQKLANLLLCLREKYLDKREGYYRFTTYFKFDDESLCVLNSYWSEVEAFE